jgi:hypothetical protein
MHVDQHFAIDHEAVCAAALRLVHDRHAIAGL